MKTEKFKSNPFAKKYKKEMKKTTTRREQEYWEQFMKDDAIETANQVKSWNRYGVGMQVVSLWSLIISFTLGFVVCAVLLTNV